MQIVLQILAALVQLIPEFEAVIPVVEKIINGETVTQEESAAVDAAMKALEQMVAAREQAILLGTKTA